MKVRNSNFDALRKGGDALYKSESHFREPESGLTIQTFSHHFTNEQSFRSVSFRLRRKS